MFERFPQLTQYATQDFTSPLPTLMSSLKIRTDELMPYLAGIEVVEVAVDLHAPEQISCGMSKLFTEICNEGVPQHNKRDHLNASLLVLMYKDIPIDFGMIIIDMYASRHSSKITVHEATLIKKIPGKKGRDVG